MREQYTNREDQLYCRVTNVVNGQITEYFKPGKPMALQGTALRVYIILTLRDWAEVSRL